MCGRYQLNKSPEDIATHFELSRLPHYQASYNIAPTNKVLCVVQRDDQSRKAVNLHWGLVPPWAKDTRNSHRMINARLETLREKPAFKNAVQRQRCLIVAEGFYEWQALPTGKQAFHIHREDHQLFAFAGLWEQWQAPDQTRYSCTVITTAAQGCMSAIHDRMPVIVAPSQYGAWLNRQNDTEQVYPVLLQPDYQTLTATPISPWVNSVAHDDIHCIEPLK